MTAPPATSSVGVVNGDSVTNGTMVHTGRLIVSCQLASGTVVTLVLPDDWETLKAMVTNIPNSLEDLTYGG